MHHTFFLQGFRVVNMASDGHCLFHVFNYFLNCQSVQSLRLLAANLLRVNDEIRNKFSIEDEITHEVIFDNLL
jgi:hypothetical protein